MEVPPLIIVFQSHKVKFIPQSDQETRPVRVSSLNLYVDFSC